LTSVPMRHAKGSKAVLNRMTIPSVAQGHIDKRGWLAARDPDGPRIDWLVPGGPGGPIGGRDDNYSYLR
jgi:hypothetical protein